MGIFDKLLPDLNKREVGKIEKIADQVMALDAQTAELTDDGLRGKTAEFRERAKGGEDLDDLLPEAFAVCREAASRALGMKHFKVQVVGGIALHKGNIAEMKTGEGKTLVATLPAYLNALSGEGVHVVTVNDYLAKRDMEWMGKLYTFLGLTVGCVIHDIVGEERQKAYRSDITYGTNNEFGFDYLRDNMVQYEGQLMQRPLNYAIVDEVDSILVDEARTPLIISGQSDKSTDMYSRANRFVKTLKPGKIVADRGATSVLNKRVFDEEAEESGDFTIEEKDKRINLTESGIKKAEREFGIENFSDLENMEVNHHVMQALKANNFMKRDVDYVVKDGEIVIVDEFTGRLMFGRRYSEGLHQAIEAKEGIKVRNESMTLATVTIQNYFRMYKKLAGMTGTAKTEEEEFLDIYNMKVIVIPTNRDVVRIDHDDAIFSTEKGKFLTIADEIEEIHTTGQPVLVGTISIEKSELLSDMLKKRGVRHNVLNAKHHEQEAKIVAEAGRLGAVTIATNMAGRGTDIILGGNPEFEAKKDMLKDGYDDETISYASSLIPLDDPELIAAREKFTGLHTKYKTERADEQSKVISLGGLFIIGTERHESRRIDNQLRGRSGRQGDPGATRFFISMEDELLRLFGGERMQTMIERLGVQEGEAIEANMLSKSIENAQKRVESRNFAARKYVLQYDNVMNKQREIIYGERRQVLLGDDMKENILGMLAELVRETVDGAVMGSQYSEEWDFEYLDQNLAGMTRAYRGMGLTDEELKHMDSDDLYDAAHEKILDLYAAKETEIGTEKMRALERTILLMVIDSKWMDHIDAMDQLRHGIGLRAIGQVDPANAYAQEGFDMFELMEASIKEEVVKYCLNVRAETRDERRSSTVALREKKQEEGSGFASALAAGGSERSESTSGAMPSKTPEESRDGRHTPVKRDQPKVGRNDPCPCGSGKKYKNCCGKGA